MKNIVLIGPPGAGKTSCGKILAELLNRAFYDTDALIEAQAGKSVREIFSQDGEEHFRQLETNLLDALINEPAKILPSVKTFVLSTGGGTPIRADNFAKLNKIGDVILIEANLDALTERVCQVSGSRPLLSDSSADTPQTAARARLTELLAVRNPIYQQAGYKIDTTQLNPQATALRVIDLLKLDA